MKNINDFLSNLTDNATHIISNPKTIEDLQKRGVKFDTTTPKTQEQIIDDLFQKRKSIALAAISKFPATPSIAIPTIAFLYDEIRECILFGLNGAAISLCGVLVEFSLKHAIVKKVQGNTYNKTEWDRIESKELGPTIEEARKYNIIDKKMREALTSFKDTVRNPYLHYNIKKITKNVIANNVKKVDVNRQQVEEVNLHAEDNPIIWGFAKRFVDRETVFKVFNFADSVVKYLFEKHV